MACLPLKSLYGRISASDFGPKKQTAVRTEMVKLGWCRNTCNKLTSRIRAMFRWAVERALVPPSVHHGLQAVKGLKAGRSDARDTDPVRPVCDADVDGTRSCTCTIRFSSAELIGLTIALSCARFPAPLTTLPLGNSYSPIRRS